MPTWLTALGPLLESILKGLSCFWAYQAGKGSVKQEAKQAQDKATIDLLKSDLALTQLSKEDHQMVVEKVRGRFP